MKDSYSVFTKKYRSDKKKMIDVVAVKYRMASDIYGDTKAVEKEELERITFSDTKQYQEEINETVKQLKEKYPTK